MLASEREEYEELLEVLQLSRVVPGNSDDAVWKVASGSGFTMKSGYDWLRKDQPVLAVTAAKQREVWGCKAPPKVKIFLWILYQKKILTRCRLARWVSGLEVLCALCGEEEESADHLFTSCRLVRWAWERMKVASGMDVDFGDLEGMWAAGKRMKRVGDRSVKAKVSQLLVPALVWAVWICRNHVIFRGQRPYGENIWELTKGLIRDWGNVRVGARGICFQDDRLVVL
ncbi:hypothetical protein QJS10_CPA06g00554 [Acorus calamus]|uniref:Reverse transcriptase zinc-binding domain-containing protein n=1 Tax=Acorus calamus TaxID=4465 RepID=A0AAV9EM00_ACOCL|nr:hypothetical protein QJS10_CPA06g00554 [Acorus calamus]